METVTISKKKYRELMAAKARLDALSNVRKPKGMVQKEIFTDLVGTLGDVKEFKGKTSIEVQHMIHDLWTEKMRKKNK